jgi:hypothetical protein
MIYKPLPFTLIIRNTVLTAIAEIKDTGIFTKLFEVDNLFKPKPGSIHKTNSQVIRINTLKKYKHLIAKICFFLKSGTKWNILRTNVFMEQNRIPFVLGIFL